MVYHVSFAEVVLLMFLIKVSLPFPTHSLRAIYVDCKNKNYFAINKIIG